MAGAYPQFTTGITVRYEGGASFAAFNNQLNSTATNARNTMGRMGRDVGRETSAMSDRFRALGLSAQVAQGPFSSLGTRFNTMSRSLTELGTSIGGTMAALAGGGALIAATAGYQNYSALLRSTTDSQIEFESALVRTFKVAQDSRSSLEGTVRLYARLVPALAQAGVSGAQLGRIVETTNKAMVLSGASTHEATAALIQFSQSLAAGRLSGDEYRSLAEQGNQLLLTIQQGISKAGLIEGFDGTRAALKKLADDQKLTTDVILKALEVMEDEVDERFERMPLTIGQAATRIQNSLLGMVGSFESSTGGLSKIASAMNVLADNMDVAASIGVLVAARFLGVGKAVAGASAGFNVLTAAIGGGFTAATLRSAVATNALGLNLQTLQANTQRLAAAQTIAAISGARGMTLLAGAMNTASVAGIGLAAAGRGLLAVLGGPLGAALTVATLGLTYLAFQKDAVTKAAGRMGISEGELRARLLDTNSALTGQNNLLAENARLKRLQSREDAQRELVAARRTAVSALTGAANAQGVDRQAILDIRRDVGKGNLNAQQAFERLRAAGVSESTQFGTTSFLGSSTNWQKLNEALTGVAAASEALDYTIEQTTTRAEAAAALQAGRAVGFISRGNGLPEGITRLGAGGPTPLTDAEMKAVASARATENSSVASIEAARRQQRVREQQILNDTTLSQEQKVEALADERRRLDDVIASEKQRASAARESAKAAREAAADQKRLGREQQQQTREGEQQADAARRAAAGFVELNEAQQIAARSALALKEIQEATGKPGGLGQEEAARLAKQVRDGAASALKAPVEQILGNMEQEQAILDLLIQGREDEAALLREKFALQARGLVMGQEESEAFLANLAIIRQQNRALQERQALIDRYAQQAGQVQGALTGGIRSILDGNAKGVGDSFKQLKNAFKDAWAESISKSLFGDLEQQARRRMEDAVTTGADRTVHALGEVRDAVLGTAPTEGGALPGSSGAGASSSLSRLGPIGAVLGFIAKPLERLNILQGKQLSVATDTAKAQANGLPANARESFNRIGADIAKGLGLKGKAADIAGGLGDALQAYATAEALTNALGIKGKAAGAIKGAATGFELGAKTGNPYVAIGTAIVGGIIGAISKVPRAYENLTVGQDGFVNSSSGGAQGKGQDATKEAASQLAGAVGSSLQSIVSALNGSLRPGSSLGSIGPVGDKFQFSPDRAIGGSVKTNTQKFDTAEEAVAAAVRSALQRGIIEGVKQSTKNLILAGNDLQRQLDKAVKFESVFTRLQQYLNPVGARLGELNREFQELAGIFKEAGASAAEYADLQKLYDLERETAIKETNSRISQALRQLISDLTVGDSGLSLRDRRANALTEFAKFGTDAAITADPEGYANAARAVLDLERQLFGSQTAYFDRLNEITETSRRLLDAESGITLPGALNLTGNAPIVDTKPITDGLGTLGGQILGGLSSLEDTMARLWSSAGGGAGARYEPIQYEVQMF